MHVVHTLTVWVCEEQLVDTDRTFTKIKDTNYDPVCVKCTLLRSAESQLANSCRNWERTLTVNTVQLVTANRIFIKTNALTSDLVCLFIHAHSYTLTQSHTDTVSHWHSLTLTQFDTTERKPPSKPNTTERKPSSKPKNTQSLVLFANVCSTYSHNLLTHRLLCYHRQTGASSKSNNAYTTEYSLSAYIHTHKAKIH